MLLHSQRRAVGSVRLVRPLSMTLLTAVAVSIAITVGLWLFGSSHTRKVRLDGYLAETPAGPRVELFASAPMLRFLRARQPVRLRYPALTPQAPLAAVGEVVSVSLSPVTTGELPALPAWLGRRAALEPLYRVTARLDLQRGAAMVAPPSGVAVDAEVRIARRRLIAWMFAPLLDIPRPA